MSIYNNDDFDADEEMRKAMGTVNFNDRSFEDSFQDETFTTPVNRPPSVRSPSVSSVRSYYDDESDTEYVHEEVIHIDNSTGDQKKTRERETKRRENLFGRFTSDKEEYDEFVHEKKLKEIRKKAGLLDDPSNYLDIGIKAFYAKKKEHNLYNFNNNAEVKASYNSIIERNAEKKFKDAYRDAKLLKDSDGDYLKIPSDKLRKIALMQMQMQ